MSRTCSISFEIVILTAKLKKKFQKKQLICTCSHHAVVWSALQGGTILYGKWKLLYVYDTNSLYHHIKFVKFVEDKYLVKIKEILPLSYK